MKEGEAMIEEREIVAECGAVFYDKKCNKTYTEEENITAWAIDHSTGCYFCPSCKKYLSVAEDVSDILNNHNINIGFDIILDSAYMLIDTYNSYKPIERGEG